MKKLALFLILAVTASAAFNSTTQWNIRTDGSDSNGGAFDPGVSFPGTDFSQQAAAQQAYTDIIIGGTTTQITSAAHPFGSTSPGNFINITSGSGCSTGRYEILSVSGTTATVDHSMGTAASTCSGNLGGALQTVTTAVTLIVGGNLVHVK